MKDKPILFSAPMVSALLDGRKTQTRRIITKQPALDAIAVFGPGFLLRAGNSDLLKYANGDTLWVREAWKPGAWREDGRVAIDYRASPELTNTPWCRLPEGMSWPDLERKWDAELRAHGSVADGDGYHHWEAGKSPLRWRPGIHMPRWASRITLTVTDVRVERLQDISEADAIAEGLTGLTKDGKLVKYGIPDHDGLPGNDDFGWHWSEWKIDPRRAYAALWDKINGTDAWNKNPWVAAYTFTTTIANIDSLTEAAA